MVLEHDMSEDNVSMQDILQKMRKTANSAAETKFENAVQKIIRDAMNSISIALAKNPKALKAIWTREYGNPQYSRAQILEAVERLNRLDGIKARKKWCEQGIVIYLQDRS